MIKIEFLEVHESLIHKSTMVGTTNFTTMRLTHRLLKSEKSEDMISLVKC